MRIVHRGCQLDLLVEVFGPAAAAAASEQRFLCSVSVFLSILQHSLTDCGSMPCFICFIFYTVCIFAFVCFFQVSLGDSMESTVQLSCVMNSHFTMHYTAIAMKML